MDEEQVVEPQEEAPLEEVVPEEPTVDEKPDPAVLEAQIKELEEKRLKYEQDAKYWREQKNTARKEFFKEKPEPQKEIEVSKPKVEDFENYEDYIEKLTDYKVESKRAEWEKAAIERERNVEIQEKESILQERIKRGFDKYSDFEDIALSPTVPITQTIKDVLMESDIPEDVAYYLGKNQTEAVRISRLSPVAAARAIAKIEQELTKPVVTNRISKAPEPIKPLGSSNTITKDPEKMTVKEYEQWRLSNGARRF